MNRAAAWLTARLTRPVAPGGLVAEIDGLRCLAIVSVFFLHLSTHYQRIAPAPFATPPARTAAGSLAAQGGLGVAVFFAISGFILILPFARHHLRGDPRPSLRAYFLRRVVRIEPPYALALLLLAAGQTILLARPPREIGPHLLASLLYVHNLVYGIWSTIDPVAWSLEIEVQFYLLAPGLAGLLALRPTARRRAVLLTLIAAGAAGSILARPALAAWRLDRSLLVHGHLFLVGLLAADLYLTRRGGAPRGSPWWDAVALLSLAGLTANFTAATVPSELAATACTGLLLAATLFGQRWTRLLRQPAIATVGGMCYSIYLLHYPLLAAWLPLTRHLRLTDDFGLNLALQAAAALPVLGAASALYFLVVERPCMAAARRLGRTPAASEIAQNETARM